VGKVLLIITKETSALSVKEATGRGGGRRKGKKKLRFPALERGGQGEKKGDHRKSGWENGEREREALRKGWGGTWEVKKKGGGFPINPTSLQIQLTPRSQSKSGTI